MKPWLKNRNDKSAWVNTFSELLLTANSGIIFEWMLHHTLIFIQWSLTKEVAPKAFCKKSVLRNFAKFTGKHLCESPFFNKVAGLKPVIVIISGSHLQWSSIFKDIVFLWTSTCSHPFFSKDMSYFAIPVKAIHLMNGPFSIIKEQLQPRILSNLQHFCRTEIVGRRYGKY